MEASLEMKGLDKAVTDLQTFAAKSIPGAARSAANTMAFFARNYWVGNISKAMVLRNTYTLRSVRVVKATGATVASIQSKVGSVAKYMAVQEDGASTQLGGKHSIPTGAAAGQPGARPRTKVVRGRFTVAAIRLAARGKQGSRARRNAISMSIAARKGVKFVYLEGANGKGLFRVGGGKRNPKLSMLWDTSKGSPKVPKNPTLQPAVERVTAQGVNVYHAALIYEARRSKLLGY